MISSVTQHRSGRFARAWWLRWPVLVSLAWWLSGANLISAQVRPLAIEGATVLTGTGEVFRQGTVVLQGGKISAVGRKVKRPLLARRVEARRKYVTPGFIDCYTVLTLRGKPRSGVATARAADAFDWYARDEIEAAWRAGITAVYLPAHVPDGTGGLGAVIRLLPHGSPDDVVLAGEAALCSSVAGRGGALARVKTTEALRRGFIAAREYREACEDYEESLKEYEEQLAARSKKAKADAAKKKASGKAKGPNEKKEGEAKAGKKEEELKKPEEPATDRVNEVLLRVLDGELRWRVEAQDPAAISNVLDIAEEFHLALVLEGATGAHLCAERLAALDVPVVLWSQPAGLAYQWKQGEQGCAAPATVLQDAGVAVCFGSGVLPSRGSEPRLALGVARAIGQGFDEVAALGAVTSEAAALLGVEDEIGRLVPGNRADVVIWSRHPFAPGARVERVYIGGREVYRADGDE